MLTLAHFLTLGALLFVLGVAGIFLNRKNVIILLMCIELMLLAVNMNFVAFSRFLGNYDGQVFVFFISDRSRCRSGHRSRDPGGAVPQSPDHQRGRPGRVEGLTTERNRYG